jgi:recombination protein RecA
MDIRRIASLKDGDKVIGNRTRVKVVKNKLAPPFRDCEFDIVFGKGISKTGDLLDLAVNHEIVNKSGTWFSYGDNRIGQGRENSRNFLNDNPDIRQDIESRLRDKLELPAPHVDMGNEGEPAAKSKKSSKAAAS